MLAELRARFETVAPRDADFCSLRYVSERNETVCVRQDVVKPVRTSQDTGVMITIYADGGAGYAATSDLTREGLEKAVDRARQWARSTAGRSVIDRPDVQPTIRDGEYRSQVLQPWSSVPLEEKLDLCRDASKRLKTDQRIVDWQAQLWHTSIDQLIVQAGGGAVHQAIELLTPDLSATANDGPETISRTFGGFRLARQGGLELLATCGWTEAPERLAAEVLELLTAPNCPSGTMDVVLSPDQMILQIHESIGHPLELDRILGDERNYAGTSFVTQDMFGSYRYGSDLLDITFDPTRADEVASYGFDDDGLPAEKQHIIKDGILLRPLGASVSQARTGMEGVANARSSSWKRPPMDRMANLNLEPGSSSFDELIGAVERGVYMESNCSWSIDDSRNKFQFGCEYGRIIENGELRGVVKKPNYRGISATFWRSLKGVGNQDTFEVLGTPYCGKGEPNQTVRVGHATPAALFENVDVFGGV